MQSHGDRRARAGRDGKHIQIDEVHSGSSVMSQGDLRLHFGIGKAQDHRRDRSQMADHAKNRKVHSVKPNQILTIREGAGIVNRFVPKK